jgi:aminoglycoside phosphotransferase (APT) family kinase protein
MQRLEIANLCRTMVPGAGAVELEALAAGPFSETYRVARDGVLYTLKVAAAGREFPADLAWETRVLKIAADAGFAPRPVCIDLGATALLTRWVQGKFWQAHEVQLDANLQRIAALLRQVHGLEIPLPARCVTPLQWVEIYATALSRRRCSIEPVLRQAALARAQTLAELPRVVGVVCHSDLHVMNLLQTEDALVLLDWEYVHVTDPLWDAAGWCANNDFAAERQWSLLSLYLGSTPSAGQWQRFRLLLALYDYVCLLWTELYLTAGGDAASAERARLLDARLRVPAHYAA